MGVLRAQAAFLSEALTKQALVFLCVHIYFGLWATSLHLSVLPMSWTSLIALLSWLLDNLSRILGIIAILGRLRL